jgi:hypothetical protein
MTRKTFGGIERGDQAFYLANLESLMEPVFILVILRYLSYG